MAESRIVVTAVVADRPNVLARDLSAVRPAKHLVADLVLRGHHAKKVAQDLSWSCGDVLTQVPPQALNLNLERGITLSPFALLFIEAALPQAQDARLAAISLTSFRNRGPDEPFMPLQDGSDVFYAAVAPGPAALSLGQGRGDVSLFPRSPLATMLDNGLVVSMDRAARQWRIAGIDDSLAVYDPRLELTAEALRRAAPWLPQVDFAVDLFGDRTETSAPYLLSCRPCRQPIASWGLQMTPVEANIVLNCPGTVFSLGPTASFGALDPVVRLQLRRHLNRHFDMGAFVGQFLGPLAGLVRKRA
ncbi:hypothetical protein BZG35_05560 [Brevundimonas sp. LM2]|uniref:hypothetical protein n=1 Tax=Brevundimonas sp. LM2 TaxID=1938605 RepID=UPI00098392F9|nr:hypothetical protein [Brevundimonas sp. LM2]AQR61176.1 hypothetical protein BZG35_05560 [Brevundimonas sp. LM2]